MSKSEKVVDKNYTEELLKKKKCSELKKICENKKINGYRGKKKNKLIELILTEQELEEERKKLEEEVKIDEKDKIEESDEESGEESEEESGEESDEESDEEEGDNYKFNGTTIICLKDGNIFKKIMDLLKEVLDVGILIINEDGISLESLDSSHVSFIQMLLNKDDFDKFVFDKKREDDLHLSVSMKSLSNILKCLNNGEQITISHEEGDNKIKWEFQNLDTNAYKSFNLNLIDQDAHDINIPKANYQCRIKTLSSEFQNLLKNLAYIGDYVKIDISKSKNKIDFKSTGIDSDACIRMTKNDYTKLKLAKDFKLSFSIDYLTKYAKSSTFSSKVSIFLKEGSPILLEYKIDNLSGVMKFYIAPKSVE
jgi:proliferating cell nuclear antigen